MRLIGIDTPETRKPRTPVECGGRKATAAMKRLVLRGKRGRSGVLISDPTQRTTDRYGRLLAYVEVGGRDIGRAMIRAGWADVYVFAVDFARLPSFRAAADAAKAASAGVWGKCGGNFHQAN